MWRGIIEPISLSTYSLNYQLFSVLLIATVYFLPLLRIKAIIPSLSTNILPPTKNLNFFNENFYHDSIFKVYLLCLVLVLLVALLTYIISLLENIYPPLVSSNLSNVNFSSHSFVMPAITPSRMNNYVLSRLALPTVPSSLLTILLSRLLKVSNLIIVSFLLLHRMTIRRENGSSLCLLKRRI